MTLTHHPDDATLMSFAAGSLPEALSAVVSTHLMVCPECRKRVTSMESIGAALMQAMDSDRAPIARPSPSALQAFEATDHLQHRPRARPSASALAPSEAVSHVLGTPLSDVKWRRLGLGVWHCPIPLQSGRGDLRLLKVQRGLAMPEHGHGGSELTLIIEGAYRDEIGTFSAGDVADLDDTVEHRPVADPETGCICLIAMEEKIRFKGMIGRLLQPFSGL
ncbi:MAG: ChrR family anti-sigma-E factor [Hyphomicrobiaceae bacterium]